MGLASLMLVLIRLGDLFFDNLVVIKKWHLDG